MTGISIKKKEKTNYILSISEKKSAVEEVIASLIEFSPEE